MASGTHTHTWKYNEVEETTYLQGNKKEYTVIRFCLYCLKVEKIELDKHK